MKCERCDKELREPGVLPTLELKALGLYHTDRMTLIGDKRTITLTANGGSAAVPQSFAELGTIDISFNQNQLVQPNSLHRLPGRPINAYPLLKDTSVIARVNAGSIVTPFVLIGFLKYRDTQDKEHIVMPIALTVPSGPVNQNISQAYSPAIIIGGNQLGEAPVIKFGTWVLEGYFTLGTATDLRVDIFANLGILYGAPNT